MFSELNGMWRNTVGFVMCCRGNGIWGEALHFGAVPMLRKHCSAAGGVFNPDTECFSLLGVHVDFTAEAMMCISCIP